MKSQLPKSFLYDCGDPACSWEDWNEAINASIHHTSSRKKRIILSYAHNGFGNQLWQHTIAFSVASSMRSKMYIGILPESLYIDGAMPPNTFAGMDAMRLLLPDEFEFDQLPLGHPDKELCDAEPFFISDRPRDWRNQNYSAHFKSNLYDILADEKPRCIKMVGYFQNYPLCADDTRQLWTPRMFQNFTVRPGPNDISIYLRCLPRHYFFNDMTYYETILSRTKFDKVWLFQAPECPTRLSGNPARDGVVAQVVRLLVTKYNASRWIGPPGLDDTTQLLHDLAGLAQSSKLIIPVSSWAFWSGLFSNATEVHVNGPPHHSSMGASMSHYIYHLEKAKLYFGRFNTTTNDIEYELDLSKITHVPTPPPTVFGASAEDWMKEPPIHDVVNMTDSGFIFD